MNWTEITLEIIILLIGLYLVFFKSYFKEKGKNLATSQDIAHITEKIELVKQQFIEKNAVLKARLDLLTNLQINHKNDERLTLIDFHKKLNKWIGLLSEGRPSVADRKNNKDLQNKSYFYELIYQEVLEAQAVLHLYIEDKKLLEVASNLIIAILDNNLQTNAQLYLVHTETNNNLINNLDLEKDLEKKNNELEKLLDKRNEIQKEYMDNMLKGLKLIAPFVNEYTNYVKNYFKKISTEQPNEFE